MSKTKMQPDTHVRTAPPITSAAMKQFYSDNAGPLLPTLLKNGLDTFTRCFVDLYRTRAGQSNGSNLLPEHLVSTFEKYFNQHIRYFELAKAVHEENGGGPISKSNVDWVMHNISQKAKYAEFEKSTVLDKDQMRIMCFAIPTSKEKKEASPEVLSEMFGSDEIDHNDEQTDSSAKPAKRNGRQTTPERRQVLDIIKETLRSIVEKSQGPDDNICPSNPQMRQIIADSSPEMKMWMAMEGNDQWVSKHLSLNAQSYGLRSPRSVLREQNKAGLDITPASIPLPAPATTEDKPKVAKKRATKPKSEKQSKCLEVIEKLQGNPKHFVVKEMTIEILKAYPELSEWIVDPKNKTWVSMRLSNIKYHQTHNTDGSPKSTQVEPEKAKHEEVNLSTDKPKLPEPAEVKLVETKEASDILTRMTKFNEDMRSGIVPPIEILRTGASLVLEIADHRVEMDNYRSKLIELENSINARLESYRKLGIEV